MPSILNSDDGVVSGTSGLKSTGGNDGLLNIQTNGSNAISISSGQRSTFPTTIGVGGATPSTSGSGISFPATQSASSDANTLDDYEEGTITLYLGDGTLTVSATGTYAKVGGIVFLSFAFYAKDISGFSTGHLRVSGLPFAPTVNNTDNVFIGSLTSNNPILGEITTGSNAIFFYNTTAASGNLNTLIKTNFDNTSTASLWGQIFYRAD